jgi:sugar phosphate isomerase/epimerase
VNEIGLSPTSLHCPVVEYIDVSAKAGYDGIGLRLFESPGMNYRDWDPVIGDAPVMREVKTAMASTGLVLYDILSYYLQPDMDIDGMKPSLEFGAELKAKWALVIGDDPDWNRQRDNFGRLCDAAAQFGLTMAIEAPVNSRKLNTLPLVLQLIAESGRPNAVTCIDPMQFMRAGHYPEMLKGQDPRLFPYTQISDTKDTDRAPFCAIGEGIVPVRKILDNLPRNIPLLLEYHHRDDTYSTFGWAKFALDTTRRFMIDYYAGKK